MQKPIKSALRSRRRSTAVIEPVEQRFLLSTSHIKHEPITAPALPAADVPTETTDPSYFTSTPTVAADPVVGKAVYHKAAKTKFKKTPTVQSNGAPNPSGSAIPYGYSPTQMQDAYGIENISFNGTAGTGAGETIAIVDAYNDPNAASDLAAFDSYFGLPTANLTVLGVNNTNPPTATTTLPGTDPAGPYQTTGNSTWEQEESLDIEWAHAIAPQAKIVLYETTSPSYLYYGVYVAAHNAAVNVVSMSWGGQDDSSYDTAYDSSYFTTPSGHTGITFVASTGDSGYYVYNGTSYVVGTEYPASSSNVVAVGGTTLNLSGNTYVSETGWGNGTSSNTSGGGGGGYGDESQPGYQSGVDTISSTSRNTPDVSMDANPNTGVPIYDSWDFGSSTPWVYGMEGGTSLAAPMFAALISIADQSRSLSGLSPLDGPTQTLSRIYALPSSDYHDITSGNNGYAAGTGYDLVTGRGSPVANQLVEDLAGVSNLAGTIDVNNGGTYTPLASQTVYLDLNNTGTYNSYDPTTTTTAAGAFSFSDIPVSSSAVRPLSASAVIDRYTTNYDTTAYVDATPNDLDIIRINPSNSNQLQVLVNGSVTYTAATSSLGALSVQFTGTTQAATFDFSNGNPIPANGARFNGGAAGDGDTLAVVGTTGNDTITVNSSQILFGSSPISYSNTPNLSVNPNGGTDSLSVNANTVTVPANTGTGILARTFSALAVASGATLRFNNASADANRTVVVVNAGGLAVSSNGKLDLNANDMIVRSGSLSTITSLLATGYANGAWNGNGIASTAAANDASKATALGALQNSINGSALFSTFDGITVSTSDVLIKHTYYGDANLDGKVNGDDYSLLDNGFNTQATGWLNGDFNYSNSITTADYALTDNAYNLQGADL